MILKFLDLVLCATVYTLIFQWCDPTNHRMAILVMLYSASVFAASYSARSQ